MSRFTTAAAIRTSIADGSKPKVVAPRKYTGKRSRLVGTAIAVTIVTASSTGCKSKSPTVPAPTSLQRETAESTRMAATDPYTAALMFENSPYAPRYQRPASNYEKFAYMRA